MNNSLPIFLALMAGISLNAGAAQLTVSINNFADPTFFKITESSDLSLRIAELVPASGTNESTHVLIEGLSLLEDGTSYFASPYSGVNVSNGEIQDSGMLYLQMPAGSELPEGTVASPIVGVVERPGSWGDLEFPETTIGGASGNGDYDNDTISMILNRGTDSFTGTTSYTVVDTDTIELDPFTITAPGPTSIDLSGAVLLRDGDRFYGTLTNLSSGAEYDALLFTVELTDIPDADGDGIPDISDNEIVSALQVGVWNVTPAWYIYGHAASWGYSPFMGHVYVSLPWVYQMNFGWLYYHSPAEDGSHHWLWSPTYGWIYVSHGDGGVFYWNDGSGWNMNHLLNPVR